MKTLPILIYGICLNIKLIKSQYDEHDGDGGGGTSHRMYEEGEGGDYVGKPHPEEPIGGMKPNLKDMEEDEYMESDQYHMHQGYNKPPKEREAPKYEGTMYTHLYLTRKPKTTRGRTNATVSTTFLYDQYFLKRNLKTKIRVHQIKNHYRDEYAKRLEKMLTHCQTDMLDHYENYTWDELMDKFRDYKEEQMCRADDRLFNKFIRRMDTVLQSGRYEKWQFHQNVTFKPKYNGEQNLMYADRVDSKMILEIRSLARSLRKQIFKTFTALDNRFLKAYFRIPYNISLYHRYPQPLNYTEQF